MKTKPKVEKKITIEELKKMVNKKGWKHRIACYMDGWHCYCSEYTRNDHGYYQPIELEKELKYE